MPIGRYGKSPKAQWIPSVWNKKYADKLKVPIKHVFVLIYYNGQIYFCRRFRNVGISHVQCQVFRIDIMLIHIWNRGCFFLTWL